jgi:hypothetical protein
MVAAISLDGVTRRGRAALHARLSSGAVRFWDASHWNLIVQDEPGITLVDASKKAFVTDALGPEHAARTSALNRTLWRHWASI